MTHENFDDDPEDYDDAMDQSYEEAMRAMGDKSTDPEHPNFDAGLATLRWSLLDKFGEDPEHPDPEPEDW